MTTLADRIDNLVIREYKNEPITRAEKLLVLVENNLDEILAALFSTTDAERLAKENEGLRAALEAVVEHVDHDASVLYSCETCVMPLVRAALAEPAPEAKQ